MSYLTDHAIAARSLAEAFAFEANECGDDRNALLLTRMSSAYSRAAADMETKVGCSILAHACTVDHVMMTQARCPVCGAHRPRGAA